MRIFISYRRDDSEGYAGRLYDRLEDHFGADSVFMDIGTLKPGQDFVWEIEEAVGSCDVLVALIGKRWLTISDAQGRPRLHDPNDFVRLEIATALKRDIGVIPVLLQGTSMPDPAQLPDDLVRLARRHALEISASRFHDDVDLLIQAINGLLGASGSSAVPGPTSTTPFFEWCDIPAGEVRIEGAAFSVRAFRMGKYPVTYAQFQQFVDAQEGFANGTWWEGLAQREAKPGEQKWPVSSHPCENVSWYDAVAYCRWLSARLGYKVRLPTEWEWQWAAQGADRRLYPWGNAFDETLCNTVESGIEQTTSVDRYPEGASPFGVMDMAGNVWEWCLNEHENPSNINESGDARRVLRGGSWFDHQDYAATGYRSNYYPNFRYFNYGFRLAAFFE